jgi:basic amino acid/polyamine antiporter, APA family
MDFGAHSCLPHSLVRADHVDHLVLYQNGRENEGPAVAIGIFAVSCSRATLGTHSPAGAIAISTPAANTTNSTRYQREHQPLQRVLGLSQSTAIVVGTIIGSGIFLVPQEMMRAVGHSSLVYLAWIAGGLLSLFGAMTYAELAARLPYAGGEYVYIRRAYGDLPAFLYMWTWFAVAKPASIATVTIGLARTLALFPSLKWLDHAAIAAPIPLAWSQLFAIAMTWLMTGLNYIGIRRAANFQLVFTWLKVLLVLVIAITCFASAHGLAANFGTIFTGAEGGFTGFMVALIAALWAYDGWNDLNMVAGEVRNPERNVPLALLFGVGIVGFLYISVNAAIQYMLPAVAVAASPRPAVAAVSVVLGATGATLVTAGMALSIFVTLNGTIMSGARVPFAAARDGLFFSRIAELSPRFGTPAPSLVLQASLSTLLLLAVGRFQQLFELAIFAEWLFYMIATTTIFVHRRRGTQESAATFRMWGYPVLPALFIAAAAVLLVYSYQSNLRNSLLGSAIIAGGIPLFYFFKRRQAP